MDTSQKVVSTTDVFQFILFNPSHGSTTNHSTNARAIPTTFPCFNDSHGGERVKVGYYRVGANLMWSESLNQKIRERFYMSTYCVAGREGHILLLTRCLTF